MDYLMMIFDYYGITMDYYGKSDYIPLTTDKVGIFNGM
jgi:hypothetical protein